MRRQNPEPIILLDNHVDPSNYQFLLQNFQSLLDLGYHFFGLEFHPDEALETRIEKLSIAVSQANEASKLQQTLQLALSILPKKSEQRGDLLKLMNAPEAQLSIDRLKTNLTTKLLLTKIKSQPQAKYQGIDPRNVDRGLIETVLTATKSDAIAASDIDMAAQIIQQIKAHQGACVFVIGAGHYGVLEHIKRDEPDLFATINLAYFYSNNPHPAISSIKEKLTKPLACIQFDATQSKAALDNLLGQMTVTANNSLITAQNN